MEAITGTSSKVATEFFTQTIELIAEVFTEANYVFVEKESFPELASYLNRLVPLLKELNKRDISNAENTFLEILNQQEITREISHALSLIPFSQLEISASMMQELGQLYESMQSV
ncbi:hypothetical protein L2E82_13370 [Cichorium intybus]|uniref:Uncharacterized protein n=1 Tax=Cichorium intybus TaxID=13427 RepID=A0ACB9EYH2_CICIN|nr:hypothetical protein L2E82_13370 [Cichorium intybus]